MLRSVRLQCFVWIAVFAFGVCLLAHTARAAELPKAGDSVSSMTFAAPLQKKDADYLGVSVDGRFAFSDISADIIMLEGIGVYCPICHEQAPTIRTLFATIQKDEELARRVKLFALASGATDMEIDFARRQHRAEYPFIADLEFENHSRLGDPGTPFTLLVRPDGTVLYSHLGKIEDADAFLKLVKQHLE